MRAAIDVPAVGSARATEARLSNYGSERVEAFSDGVIAVIITIMVLEMKVPHGAELALPTSSGRGRARLK